LSWVPEFQLAGPGPGLALLLGGFGAGPENLRPLALRLQSLGLTVVVSALGRHTGDEALFERSRTWHYYADALRVLRRVAPDGSGPVLLGGYSTGALVALLLAVRHPDRAAGLVLLSPVLRTARARTQLVGYSFGGLYYLALPLAAAGATLLLSAAIRRRGWRDRSLLLRALGTTAVIGTAALGLREITVPLRTSGAMVVDGEEVLPAHFRRASLVTGSTLVPLQMVARRLLPELAVPTCVVFGEADDVVDVRFGTTLSGSVRDAEVHVVPGAPHRVVATPQCLDIVGRFAQRVIASRPG
jgi:pimeloyl-ACP methyl ester carboxylesterase